MRTWLKQNSVFIATILVAMLIILFGVIYSERISTISEIIMQWVSVKFGWLYIWAIVIFCVFCSWVALSKYGKLKLGKENDTPEFSNFSWYSMLFCGSTGIGLVFWSIAEPLSHYSLPPVNIEPGSSEAIDFSIRTCYLHWGLTQWVCFAVVGLAIAYFQFRKGKNALLSNLIVPLFGKKTSNGVVGKLVDSFAVVVSFAGVATSLGLGVSQICGGLDFLFSIPNTTSTILAIIIVITIVYVASAITGIYKGIKILSNLNTILALLLLILAIIVGPKIAIFNNLTHSIGQHIQYLFSDLMLTNAFGNNDWVMNWRVFYYAWFIAWTPFVGMFIARISKGRTIREFIIGVVFIPTLFSILWLAVFSTIALSAVQGWNIENVQQLVASPETAVFIIFSYYPLKNIISLVIVILLGVFFITSADSATYSLGVMTSNGDLTPPIYKKLLWGIIIAIIAFILLSAGSLKPLQTISIAASLPFLFIIFAIILAMIKELKKENTL